MTTLIVGATGATGRLLVAQLLERGESVRAVVRSPEKLPASLKQHKRLSVMQAPVLDPGDAEMARLITEDDLWDRCQGLGQSE